MTITELQNNINEYGGLCAEFQEVQKANNIYCMGLGVGSMRVPVRVMGYPILAYELLQNQDRKLEMYMADEFNALLTGESSDTEPTKSIIQTSIIAFVENFRPELQDRVRFVPTTGLSDERNGWIDTFTEVIQSDRQVQEFADRYNGRESIRYLAAHSLYMRDPLNIPPSAYLVEKPEEIGVTMIGGPQEKITKYTRQLIYEAFGDKRTPLNSITTNYGRIPPYYASRNEEPYLTQGQLITAEFLMTTVPEIYRDLAVMLKFIANDSNYSEIFGNGSAKESQRRKFLDNPSIGQSIYLLNNFLNQL